jgi:hypothetical protein
MKPVSTARFKLTLGMNPFITIASQQTINKKYIHFSKLKNRQPAHIFSTFKIFFINFLFG